MYQRLRDEGDVDNRDVNPSAEIPGRQISRVDALHRYHARIGEKLGSELPVTRIDRKDPGGSAAEQTVGKAPGRRPDINRGQPADTYSEAVERRLELEPAASDVRDCSVKADFAGGVGIDILGRFTDGFSVYGYKSGQNRPLRVLPAPRVPLFDKEEIRSHFFLVRR